MFLHLKTLATAACLVAFAACQTPPADSRSSPSVASVSPVKYIEANGARLPYVEQGQGAPVVFVHGAVSDYRTWDRQRASISAHYRAISYTQRYFGTEPWDKDGPKFGVQTHADDLTAFIRGLGTGPVHLVAWSYSGHVVLTVALKNPELVRSAFIYEPAVPTYVTDAATLKAIGDDRGAMFGDAVKASQRGDNAAAVRLLIDGVGERSGYFNDLPPAAQQIMLDSAPSMPALFSPGAPPQISCEQLGQIKPPVAIVRGERVRPYFRLIADAAARCMPSHRHIVAPNAKHMWPGEDVQAFNQTLLDFLKRQ